MLGTFSTDLFGQKWRSKDPSFQDVEETRS